MTETITNATRETAILAAVEAAKQVVASGAGIAEEIRWKADKLVLPVASVALDMVLLSPHSHRIKAQLQSLPQAQQDVVGSDPYGTPGQAIIAQLLRETPGYERIKSAIANDGQLFPGVLTTGGVLVNANTRAVALRELREQYIKVVVLPADAGPREITELELRLQMEQEVKQEYSFTSQLLFIEDLINSGNYTTAEVGRGLRPALTTSSRDTRAATDLVEGELRLLGLIREVVGASGGAMTFLSFDEQRQALIEIDQDYQRLKTTQPEEAQRVRDAQLAGMIAGVDYRRLRDVDSSLLDTYIAPALRESTALAPYIDMLLSEDATALEASETPFGVDDFFGDGEDDLTPTALGPSDRVSLSTLYTLLARTRPDENVPLPAADGETASLPHTVIAAELFSGLLTAIENKRRDSRQIDDLTAPMVHLKEAARLLDKAAIAYSDVYRRASFDRSNFDSAVQEYERAAAAFAAVTEPTEDTGV
jgi:hypothetical protein